MKKKSNASKSLRLNVKRNNKKRNKINWEQSERDQYKEVLMDVTKRPTILTQTATVKPENR